MIMAGIDRDTTIAFLHGYLAHKRGDNIVDVQRVEGSKAIFLEDCVDTPKARAMGVLEKALGSWSLVVLHSFRDHEQWIRSDRRKLSQSRSIVPGLR